MAFDPATRARRDTLREGLDAAAFELANHRRVGDSLGTSDMTLAARVEALGFDGGTAHVFDLLPLVHVAWADGVIQRSERALILDILAVRQVPNGSAPHDLVCALLEERPSDAYLSESLAVLQELLSSRAATGETIASLCVDVASASRGLFGLGRSVDRRERQLLGAIGDALGERALAIVRERLS